MGAQNNHRKISVILKLYAIHLPLSAMSKTDHSNKTIFSKPLKLSFFSQEYKNRCIKYIVELTPNYCNRKKHV